MTHPVQLKVLRSTFCSVLRPRENLHFTEILLCASWLFGNLITYLTGLPPRGWVGRVASSQKINCKPYEPPLVWGEREHIKLDEMCQNFQRLILSNICQKNMTIRLGVSKFFWGTIKCQKNLLSDEFRMQKQVKHFKFHYINHKIKILCVQTFVGLSGKYHHKLSITYNWLKV